MPWDGRRRTETSIRARQPSQAATDLTNETALSHLDKVLFSELGALFVDSRNAMTFQERYGRLREPYDASQATYGDSPGARSYVGIELEQTDQNVYNDVRIEPKDGTEQISVDETSPDGVRPADPDPFESIDDAGHRSQGPGRHPG